ncbi:hypothetical protein CBR_g39188 [Chara braunii]|uniref:DDE Tnp4 domain-containing protein n=1 Tax=Chara braunii TaxID=69332 RepID=A0A388LRI9_CHABU|nr:hypothetical protein CBR_g39188 [Chara braunii]|eukprot:GBG84812.1 hypothetical protein CBR_g39188 [Chara braunii]
MASKSHTTGHDVMATGRRGMKKTFADRSNDDDVERRGNRQTGAGEREGQGGRGGLDKDQGRQEDCEKGGNSRRGEDLTSGGSGQRQEGATSGVIKEVDKGHGVLWIVAACAAYVEKKVTHYRMPLPVEQVIAFALYRWASGETYESSTSAFGIGRATGLQAVRDVTSALLQAYPDAIKWPVGRRRAHIQRAFRDKGSPNCFGAIDCTHIYIDKPAGALSENYYNRKQKFSVQAQVVVDLDMRVLDVHVGYPESVHDVRVLHNSQLWRRAEVGELFDVPPENLPHGVVTRGYLLGDNSYPVACPWIMQSYGGIDQDPDEERFDMRQKVARGCVERAFGRLKCMWRLFLRTHKMNLEALPQQFVAVCTLHNILLDAGIDFDENLLWEVDENGVRRRVDLGIVGNSAGGRRRSTNVQGDLLRDALQDRLALM